MLSKNRGFYTLIERECYRFARLSKQTLLPPIITTLLFIFIFGFSLGSRIREIEGFAYIIYILPGLTTMGVVTNSYANTSTSLFMAKMDRSVENILAAPISYYQIASAMMIGGLIRGILIGTITLGISILSVHMPLAHPFWAFLVLILNSILFSSLGIISGLWSESWDQIATFTNFIITPFVYLGGVFYSIHMLPPFWQKVSLANPIFYLVDALRWCVLGKGDISFVFSLSFILGVSIISYWSNRKSNKKSMKSEVIPEIVYGFWKKISISA